ncbi:MAG: Cell division ATP-binding protein FtsE [Candidatus Pacebacteria bacterium GW2011_GWB1_47_8]|nr:MAG: Cell division ATP-binding protein FtsE [Candidatus Pacebacteria bacterium GW2011_GWA1_46_10]KKU84175.1 MAG: Cell division ATP-binding protein FtsE [Candidatus Pacebacteria bacterium GW2011_GWB1_47_8]HCR81061.1 hypothetical protein [Candidatus Paceibacterota bacterium]
MITFTAVTKRFGDGTVALDNVSFHVEPGELVVVTGPSGAGKTTLMRLLIRDFLPTEGEIMYKDESVTAMPAGQVPFHRRKIGVVFQDYRLLSELNVWENIALPLSILGKPESEIESRVTDLLSLIGLTERALVFPKQLSGGEAQRVSIARALATGPSVVFADEPTGNLDKQASLSIVKLLQQINSLGTTVLLATHDVTLLAHLENERQLDLEHGQLVHDSRPSPMKTTTKTEESKAKTPVKTAVETLDESREAAAPPIKPAEESAAKPEAKPEEEPEEKSEKPEKSATEETATPKKSSKKKPTKKVKTLKTKVVEDEDLAQEFTPVTATAPSAKKTSWLKKISGGLPSIKLPAVGKKSPKPEKKET